MPTPPHRCASGSEFFGEPWWRRRVARLSAKPGARILAELLWTSRPRSLHGGSSSSPLKSSPAGVAIVTRTASKRRVSRCIQAQNWAGCARHAALTGSRQRRRPAAGPPRFGIPNRGPVSRWGEVSPSFERRTPCMHWRNHRSARLARCWEAAACAQSSVRSTVVRLHFAFPGGARRPKVACTARLWTRPQGCPDRRERPSQ